MYFHDSCNILRCDCAQGAMVRLGQVRWGYKEKNICFLTFWGLLLYDWGNYQRLNFWSDFWNFAFTYYSVKNSRGWNIWGWKVLELKHLGAEKSRSWKVLELKSLGAEKIGAEKSWSWKVLELKSLGAEKSWGWKVLELKSLGAEKSRAEKLGAEKSELKHHVAEA